LVASYQTGMFNENGEIKPEEDFSDLFGIKYNKSQNGFTDFDVYMKIINSDELNLDIKKGKLLPTGGMHLNIETTDADIVAQVLGGSEVHYGPLSDSVSTPTIVKKHIASEGRIVYFAIPIGNRYLEFGVLDYFKLINAAVKWAAGINQQIIVKNAPRTLALSAFIQNDFNRNIIHLVNSIRDEINQPIIELNECKNIKLNVKTNNKPKKITESGKLKLDWQFKNKELVIDIPNFYDYKVIVIEY